MHEEQEQELAGGNAAGTVVRVDGTVRKPWTAATSSVQAYMAFLRDCGIDVPSPMGQDAQGRQVIEFVPGQLAIDAPQLSQPELRRVGAMVRAIHDASRGFVMPSDAVWDSAIAAPGADLVCHNDLAPWNLIIGDRWLFIDWDAAAPSTRLWDLAYADRRSRSHASMLSVFAVACTDVRGRLHTAVATICSAGLRHGARVALLRSRGYPHCLGVSR